MLSAFAAGFAFLLAAFCNWGDTKDGCFRLDDADAVEPWLLRDKVLLDLLGADALGAAVPKKLFIVFRSVVAHVMAFSSMGLKPSST